MSGKAKSWHYLPPWQQQEIHIHTVDLHLMLALSLVTGGGLLGVLLRNSHDTTFEKVGGQFPLLLSETVIKRKKISLKQPWPSQITYCTICNRAWDLGQRKGFWNLLFVFGFPSNNISERDCTYFLGDSTVFLYIEKETTFFFHSFKFCSNQKWLNLDRTNMRFNIEHSFFCPQRFLFWNTYLNIAIFVPNIMLPRPRFMCMSLCAQRNWCQPSVAVTPKTKKEPLV